MKVRLNKASVVFTEIYDEATYEMVNEVAETSKSKITWEDNSTKARVTSNLSAFVAAYNKY